MHKIGNYKKRVKNRKRGGEKESGGGGESGAERERVATYLFISTLYRFLKSLFIQANLSRIKEGSDQKPGARQIHYQAKTKRSWRRIYDLKPFYSHQMQNGFVGKKKKEWEQWTSRPLPTT